MMPRVVRHHPSYVAFGAVPGARRWRRSLSSPSLRPVAQTAAVSRTRPSRPLVYDFATDFDPAFFRNRDAVLCNGGPRSSPCRTSRLGGSMADLRLTSS